MASSAVRINNETKEMLKKLAAKTGRKMQTVLDEAVELYRRQRFLGEASAAFAALRKDNEAGLPRRKSGRPGMLLLPTGWIGAQDNWTLLTTSPSASGHPLSASGEGDRE